MGAIALMHRLSLQDFDQSRQMLEALTERVPRQPIPWAWFAKWYVLSRSSRVGPAIRQWILNWLWIVGRRALDADPQCSLALDDVRLSFIPTF